MADNASTTNTPSDASSTVETPKQSFDQLFTFDGGDVEITANFQGQKVAGKVAAQAMVLASPVSIRVCLYPVSASLRIVSYFSRARGLVELQN